MAEFGALGAVFKHAIPFDCLYNWPLAICEGADAFLVSVYGALGAMALFVMLVPSALRQLAEAKDTRRKPLLLHIAGITLALFPVLVLREGTGTTWMIASLGTWVLAVGLILWGALWILAPWHSWRVFLSRHGLALGSCLAAGAAMPVLALRSQDLWTLDWLADRTFEAVAGLLAAAGYAVEAWPDDRVIGAEDFFVQVNQPCSGIEGTALVTLFVTLYLVLFRQQLRFPLALILYPLGLAASAAFNVLRIAVLVAIGIEGHPELATGGFHSHAGWLAFTLVALIIVALAETVPQLKRTGAEAHVAGSRPGLPPFWQDPAVGSILPFAVFMLSAVFASTFSQTPGVLYPLRMLLVGAVLTLFWPLYRSLVWRITLLPVMAGGAVGLLWILIPVPGLTSPPYGALAGPLLVLWFVIRGVGTVLLVPMVEELFFRDYLESRLRIGRGWLWTGFAALVTASLFAALHDRWAEAFVAGLVFSALARHRNRITDAILAHAVANAVVYAAAVANGNLAII
ncbi:exosortase E/protease, VPEID-CTERM system [Marinovum sp.]|uniref:exosortase E/protease, VPEID-CTERM system n=1 Tax=Marinovum sp. TaxID=2024839 RepID=UPI003A8E010A